MFFAGHNLRSLTSPIKWLDVSTVKRSHCGEEVTESLSDIPDLEPSEGDSRSPEGLAEAEDSA